MNVLQSMSAEVAEAEEDASPVVLAEEVVVAASTEAIEAEEVLVASIEGTEEVVLGEVEEAQHGEVTEEDTGEGTEGDIGEATEEGTGEDIEDTGDVQVAVEFTMDHVGETTVQVGLAVTSDLGSDHFG